MNTPIHDQVVAETGHVSTVEHRNFGWLRNRPTCARCGPLDRWMNGRAAENIAYQHESFKGAEPWRTKHGVRS